MAGEEIDSNPLEAEERLDSVPQDRWDALMCKRELFVKEHLAQDCRCLVQFVADAERMAGPLGFHNGDDFIARGLKLASQEIRLAVDWLKINRPQEAIPYEVVQRLAMREIGVAGRSRLKHGNSRAYILARLERAGFRELAAKVRAHEISVSDAAIAAGFRKKLTPLDRIKKLTTQLSPADRSSLIEWLLRQ